jgi:hypothetical protein
LVYRIAAGRRDTEYDEEVSQVMIAGGIYTAPADTFKLCGGCTQVLALIWASNEQENACPASTSTDSAA